MKKQMVDKISQNGRYGLSIVAEEGTVFPSQGRLDSLGRIEGRDCYEFFPGPTGQWVEVGGDLEPVAGCTLVISVDLQGHHSASVLIGGGFYVFRDYGYCRRGSRIVARKGGQEINLPAPVLAAAGLLPVERRSVEVEVPALDSPLAAALKAAGIA